MNFKGKSNNWHYFCCANVCVEFEFSNWFSGLKNLSLCGVRHKVVRNRYSCTIKAVCNNDYAPLRAIQYNGSQLLNDGDIAAIFQTLRQDFQYESLECLRFDDLPQIIVTKYVDTGGVRKPIKNQGDLSLWFNGWGDSPFFIFFYNRRAWTRNPIHKTPFLPFSLFIFSFA